MNRILTFATLSRLNYLVVCCVLVITFQIVTVAQEIPDPCDIPETGPAPSEVCISPEICIPALPPLFPPDGCTRRLQQGSAGLNPATADGSPSTVSAIVDVVDTKTALIVRGRAVGMEPDQVYVSLFYDINSFPTGPNACLPTPGDTSLNFSQMVIGYWLPIGSSIRTLTAIKVGPAFLPVPLAYARLAQIGTVSVRLDTDPRTPIPAQADPNRFRLRACGSLQQ
jgi:hypothetical protein